MKNSFLTFGVLVGILFLGLNGCASKAFVKEQISQSINPVHLQTEKNRAQIAALEEMTTGLNKNHQKASIAAEKALTRAEKALARSGEALTHAQKAGKLARGKLLFYVTFTDESVHFGFDVSSLTDEAKAALDSFAEHVKAENKNAYIEIQGHTDSVGTDAYNLRLGMARAEAVKRYLHTQHHIPLHRMSTFSYGESMPIVENDTTQNRAKNRRITIEVLE